MSEPSREAYDTMLALCRATARKDVAGAAALLTGLSRGDLERLAFTLARSVNDGLTDRLRASGQPVDVDELLDQLARRRPW